MKSIHIRQMGPRDILSIRSINVRAERTDLPFGFTLRDGNLINMLSSMLPQSLATTRAYVSIVDNDICGYAFVDALDDRYRWDIVALGAGTRHGELSEEAHSELWTHLIEYTVDEASKSGARRIFASAPDGSTSHICFRANGFEPYVKWHSLCGCVERRTHGSVDGFRRFHRSDVWSAHQLYHRITPRMVQFAEALTSTEWEEPKRNVRSRMPMRVQDEHRFVVESAQGIGAYSRISRGKRKNVVSFLVEPEFENIIVRFIESSLTAAGVESDMPIELVIPGYLQENVQRFIEAGLQLMGERIGMVRHTTVSVVVRPELIALPVDNNVERTVTGIPTLRHSMVASSITDVSSDDEY